MNEIATKSKIAIANRVKNGGVLLSIDTDQTSKLKGADALIWIIHEKRSLAVDKLLSDPVFARNSTYRQILDRLDFGQKRGDNNESSHH
jgi:hypothetical protein